MTSRFEILLIFFFGVITQVEDGSMGLYEGQGPDMVPSHARFKDLYAAISSS